MSHHKLLKTLLLLLISLSWGCSTTMVGLDYEGNPEPVADRTITSGIGQIVVVDNRGTDADWLGAIRGGYGNVLKSIRTDGPTSEIVANVYRQAFVEYGYLDEPNGEVLFSANIEKLDCSYYFNREAHAHIDISLLNRNTNELLFSDRYVTDLTEGGVGAGVFGDVETLRDLAEEALNQTVDKSMTDLTFVAALARAGKPVEGNYVETLRGLKDAYDQGLISEEEYQQNKQKALDSM
jgi:hypothetical protein